MMKPSSVLVIGGVLGSRGAVGTSIGARDFVSGTGCSGTELLLLRHGLLILSAVLCGLLLGASLENLILHLGLLQLRNELLLLRHCLLILSAVLCGLLLGASLETLILHLRLLQLRNEPG